MLSKALSVAVSISIIFCIVVTVAGNRVGIENKNRIALLESKWLSSHGYYSEVMDATKFEAADVAMQQRIVALAKAVQLEWQDEVTSTTPAGYVKQGTSKNRDRYIYGNAAGLVGVSCCVQGGIN